MKTLIEKILFYISVPKCVCCGERLTIDEHPICNLCIKEYESQKHRQCSICFQKINNCTCTNDYLNRHSVKKLIKIYRYLPGENLPTNKIIYSLKRDNRKDVIKFLAEELSPSISNAVCNPENYVFSNVPRRKRSIAKYGVDHSELLARELANIYSAEFYQPLVSKSKKDQKKTIGEERITNAQYNYKKDAKCIAGKNIILVDDIVTTGASMGAVATLFKGLGAKKIIGATVSIAYKDPYKPFSTDDRFFTK